MVALADDADLKQVQQILDLLEGRFVGFQPRPDRPESFDQQTGFIESKAKVSICEGGNGAGKTESAAQKAARFMLWKQPPPWKDSTFLVVSDTFNQVANICWKEKLSEIIPKHCVDWGNIRWQDSKMGHPFTVPLHPWPNRPEKNWTIEFRSLDQGRRAFQGRRYAGFWFSEQFEWPVFEEVLRGCRETYYDGAHFAEFTPVDPDLCIAIEEKQEAKIRGELPDWEFFRLNSRLNKSERIAAGAIESYLSTVSEALLDTRTTGAHPSFAGAIYPEFNVAVHVLDDDQWEEMTGCRLPDFPSDMIHTRGMDFGESVSHPFVCLWGFEDGGGNWFVYDEFVEDTGLVLYRERIERINDRWNLTRGNRWGATHADPSRPLVIMEFCEGGIPTMGARNDVHDGIETIRKLLKTNPLTGVPKLFIHKQCKHLISEMRRYRWVLSPAEVIAQRGGRLPANPQAPRYEPLKWKDDAVDALRYMIHSETAMDITPTSTDRGFAPRKHGVFGVDRAKRSWRR